MVFKLSLQLPTVIEDKEVAKQAGQTRSSNIFYFSLPVCTTKNLQYSMKTSS